MTVLIWLTHGREEKKKENPHHTPLLASNRLSRRKSHPGQGTGAGVGAPCPGLAQRAQLRQWKSYPSILRVPPSSSFFPCNSSSSPSSFCSSSPSFNRCCGTLPSPSRSLFLRPYPRPVPIFSATLLRGGYAQSCWRTAAAGAEVGKTWSVASLTFAFLLRPSLSSPHLRRGSQL